METVSYFVSATKEQIPDAYEALTAVMDIKPVVLPHTWHATTKRGEVVGTILCQLRHARTLLSLCAKERRTTLLICADNHYSALLVARLLQPLWKNVRVYLLNFYLHELGKNAIVKTVLRLLLSQKVAILVQTHDEVAYFRNLNARMSIEMAPFSLPERGWMSIPCIPSEEIRLGDYVFAGGRSNRDHQTVIKAADKLPHIPFVIAASKRYAIEGRLPANVRLLEDLPSDEFHTLLAGSRCVVISLKENVGSSGQMVTLAAMHYGKLVLYSEMPAISQYFADGKAGVAFRAADCDDLARKLSRYFPDTASCDDIGRAAKHQAEALHSRSRFLAKLVSHLTAWASELDRGRRPERHTS